MSNGGVQDRLTKHMTDLERAVFDAALAYDAARQAYLNLHKTAGNLPDMERLWNASIDAANVLHVAVTCLGDR